MHYQQEYFVFEKSLVDRMNKIIKECRSYSHDKLFDLLEEFRELEKSMTEKSIGSLRP